ncbi:hypothetical protein ACIRS1_06795 [Kitasatospora sp. NPDC101176]
MEGDEPLRTRRSEPIGRWLRRNAGVITALATVAAVVVAAVK